MRLKKNPLNQVVFILLSLLCLFTMVQKPSPATNESEKSQTTLNCNKNTEAFCVSTLEQEHKTFQQKQPSPPPCKLFFCKQIFITFNFVVTHVDKMLYDLSYWGQKIQNLSSRSHPPTFFVI